MSDATNEPGAEELLRHAAFLRRLTGSLLRDPGRADDAVQETFAAALDRPPDKEGPLRSWLGRVARNFSLMRLREEGRRRRRERAVARWERIPSPAEAVERLETQRIVVDAVRDLSEPYRSTIVLRFFEDLSPKEIARAQGIPVDTVRTRVRRALGKLRSALDGRHGGNRRAWQLALLPLAFGTGTSSAASWLISLGETIGGGAVLSGKKVAAIVALAVVAGLVAWWGVARLDGGGAPLPPDAEKVSSPPTPAAERSILERGSPTSAGAVVGIVSRRGEPTPAAVEVRRVGPLDPRLLPQLTEHLDTRALLRPSIDSRPVGRAESGTDGLFRIAGLDPGRYRVTARTPDGCRGADLVRVHCAGQTVETHLIVQGGPETLTGRAVWSDGSPFAGFVSAHRGADIARPAAPEVFVATARDGRFRIRGLEPGTAKVAFVEAGHLLTLGHTVRLPHQGEAVFVVDEGLDRLTGRAVSAVDGSPVPGAEVDLWSHRSDYSQIVSHQVTGLDGTFRMLGIAPSPTLRVQAKGFLPLTLRVSPGASPLRVDLTPSPRIRGRVVLAAGRRPVEGIPVFAFLVKQGSATCARTRTGRDGGFTLPDLPGLEVMVFAHGNGLVSEGLSQVRAGGGNPLALSLRPAEERTLELTVVPAATAKGRVTEAGGPPLAGVPVFANPALPYPTNWMATRVCGPSSAATGEDGRFRIDTLIPGVPYTFLADPAQRIRMKIGPLLVTAGAPAQVDFGIAALRRLRVLVTEEENGRPIPGAVVEMMRQGVQGGWINLQRWWITGPDGTVDCCPVPGGALRVGIYHRDFASPYLQHDVEGSKSGGEDLSISLRLGRGGSISGVVRRADGSPFHPGVVLSGWQGSAFGGPRPDAGGVPVRPDGTFELTRLPPGRYRPTVCPPSREWHHSGPLAQPGTKGVVITVPDRVDTGDRTVPEAHVLGPHGDPVPFGEVRFHSVLLLGGYPFSRTTTGRFRNGIARANQKFEWKELWIDARPARSSAGEDLGATLAGPFGPKDELLVRLLPAVTLEGTVTGPSGEPVRGVRVSATPVLASRGSGEFTSPPHGWDLTDDNGHFRIEGLSAIRYRIEASPPTGLVFRDAVEGTGGASGISLGLAAGISPVLTVRDADGAPLRGAEIVLSPADEPAPRDHTLHRPKTGTDGRVVVGPLEPGERFRLKVVPPHRRKDLFPHDVESWIPADAEFTLERAYVISGRVLDPEGNPAVGARVQIWPRDAEPGDWTDFLVKRDGSFELPRLTAGPRRIRARPASGLEKVSHWKTVLAGTRGIELRTDLRHALEVRIEGMRGEPGGKIELTPDDDGRYHAPRRDHFGEVRGSRFIGLIPGRTYAFRYVSPDRTRGAFLGRIRADAGEVTLRVEPTAKVTGRVVAPPGVKVTRVLVRWRGFHFGGEVAADGSFVVTGVPDDAFLVRAWGQLGKVLHYGEAGARAGDSVDVRIDVKER